MPAGSKPGLFERMIGTTAHAALTLFTGELASIRRVLEIGVDSYRAANGMPAVFPAPELPEVVPPEPIAQRDKPAISLDGQFQTIWLIQELAKEGNLPITPDTDLVELAQQQGWMDPAGHLVQIPTSAKNYPVDQEGRYE